MSAPQYCDGCTKPGDATQQDQAHKGTETKIAGVDTYVTGSGSQAVLICTDVYGWLLPRVRSVADQYASAGDFTVYMPHYLNDPLLPEQHGKIDMGQWFVTNPMSQVAELSQKVAKELSEKHQGNVQAVGYCLGVRAVVDLMKAGLIKAGVGFHPSFLTKEDTANITKPFLFNCSEVDGIFTPEIRAHFEETLKDRKDVQFIEYPGTNHGFGVRPTGPKEQEESVKAQEACCKFLAAQA